MSELAGWGPVISTLWLWNRSHAGHTDWCDKNQTKPGFLWRRGRRETDNPALKVTFRSGCDWRVQVPWEFRTMTAPHRPAAPEQGGLWLPECQNFHQICCQWFNTLLEDLLCSWGSPGSPKAFWYLITNRLQMAYLLFGPVCPNLQAMSLLFSPPH